MTNLFSLVKRNGFDLSQERKFTCNMGKLYPIMYEEVYPGDDFRVKTQCVVRLQPMTAPVMHRVNVKTYYFYVPYRLLYKDWENFITGGKYGNDSPNKDGSNPYVLPYVTLTSPSKRDLSSYFGLPCVQNYVDGTTYDPHSYNVSAMPFRAVQKIVNDWFIDEFLSEEVEFSTDGGLDTTINTDEVPFKCWRKDRFTNARISEQLGDPVYLPLGIDAPVVGDGKTLGLSDGTRNFGIATLQQNGNMLTEGYHYGTNIGNPNAYSDNINTNRSIGVTTDGSKSGLKADLSDATGVTVDAVKTAFRIQQFMSEQARSGYRYVEHILTHFGVRSPDGRLQRSEFLGGGNTPIIVSEVLQTSETTENGTPQGNMAGHGISVGNNHAFTKSFTEYGCIVGFICIMPETSYQQGIDRQFTRENKFDFLTPLLAPINQQAVKYKELYVTGDPDKDEATWGFHDQYDELRHRPNIVAGDLVDNMADWHFGRIFKSRPNYNEDFVKANPSKRMFAVTDESEDCCIVDLYNKVHAIRPLPKRGDTAII